MFLARRLSLVKTHIVRSVPLKTSRFESVGFNAKKGRISTELVPRSGEEILELWSNRNCKHKAHESLTCLRQIARGNIGFEKLLHHPGYHYLFQSFSRDLGTAETTDVAETLFTCAQQRLHDKKLVMLMVAELEKRNFEHLSDKYLGFIPYGLVLLRVGISSRSLITKCVQEVRKRLCDNNFSYHHSLVLLSWALTATEQWSLDFVDVIHAFIKKHAAQLSPSQLSIFLWSLGRAKHVTCKLIKVVLSNIVVNELDPIPQSQIFQTLGDASFCDKRYFDALAEYVVAGQKGCLQDPWFINILMKTCANVNYYNFDMMDCLANAALEQLSNYSISGLYTTGHAFSRVNHIRKDLLLAIFKELCSREKNRVDFSDWISLAWACLVAEIYPPELFQLKTWEQAEFAMTSTSHSLLLWDLTARHEFPELHLPSPPIKQMIRCMDTILTSPSNTTSSFEQTVLSALQLIFDTPISVRQDALSISGWSMDIELLLDAKGRVIAPPKNTYKPATYLQLARIAYLCFQHGVHLQKMTSDMRTRFHTLLTSLPAGLGCCHQLAHDWMLDGPLPVARKIAIEADGPTHFSFNNKHPLGSTVLKKRQLEAVGWEVIQIPHFEWSNDICANVEYLREQIFGGAAKR